jgi:hypothetical protein
VLPIAAFSRITFGVLASNSQPRLGFPDMPRSDTPPARPLYRRCRHHSRTPFPNDLSYPVNAHDNQYIHAAGPFVPIAHLVPALPRLSYQLFFDRQTEAAIAELNKDIRRTLRATLRTSTSPVPPRFLTNPNSFMAEWDEFSEVRTRYSPSYVTLLRRKLTAGP